MNYYFNNKILISFIVFMYLTLSACGGSSGSSGTAPSAVSSESTSLRISSRTNILSSAISATSLSSVSDASSSRVIIVSSSSVINLDSSSSSRSTLSTSSFYSSHLSDSSHSSISSVASSSFSAGLAYREPGNYPEVPGCAPFVGTGNAPFKLIFVNLNQSERFDSAVNSAIENEFFQLRPYSDHKENMAFYKIALEGEFNCQGVSASLSGSGLSCDNQKINKAIQEKCNINNRDIYALIKIVITPSNYGGAADEVIYVGDLPMFGVYPNTIIHEVSHNLGLADLYSGSLSFKGVPIVGWSADYARKFSNVDGPGCAKWCNSYKPASEYNQSVLSACATLKTKEECISFKRKNDGDCDWNSADGHYECCTWSDVVTDDYFKSACVPIWGTENIGLDCLDGAGCYFGAAYGAVGWRPTARPADDLMMSLQAAQFSALSIRELDKALTCCASSLDSSESCRDYRKMFSDFMSIYNFKKAFGSCQAPMPR